MRVKSPPRLLALTLLGAALALLAGVLPSSAASEQRRDADARVLRADLTDALDRSITVAPSELGTPERAAGIGPGSRLVVTIPDGEGGEVRAGCSANFVWDDGSSLFLGTAGHCLMPEDRTATHGPGADWDASGVVARVCVSECSFGGLSGFVITGELVELGDVAYARQVRLECADDPVSGEEECSELAVGNDFGVVEIPQDLEDAVRSSLPVFGGPQVTEGGTAGDPVCHYGAGAGFGETWPTMGRTGVAAFSDDTSFVFEGAVMPGDSGSAAETCDASASGGLVGDSALGAITHITAAGNAGTAVERSALMAHCDADLDLDLVLAGGSRVGLPGSCDALGDRSGDGNG